MTSPARQKDLAPYALLTSVLLNCLGLIIMRLLSQRIDTITSLFIGYLIAAAPLLFPKISGRPLLPSNLKDYFLIFLWGLSLSSVYFLFIGYPSLVTPSQVIFGLTLAPLTAAFMSGDLKFSEALAIHKLKIAPITLLLILAFLETKGRSSHSMWTFALIWILFSFSQTAARKLSRIESPFYAQSRMAVIVAISLLIFMAFRINPTSTGVTLLFGLFFGMLLTVVFRFTLYGIRNSSAIGSALMLSLNVPFSLIGEAILLGRKLTIEQMSLATIYVVSILFIQYRMRVSKSVLPDVNSKP